MFVGEYGELNGNYKKISELTKGTRFKVKVKCPSCLEIREVRYSQIVRNGHHYCQACALRNHLQINLKIGSVYGRLTVIKSSNEVGKSICKCECGNIGNYRNSSLKNGRTRSCGCLKKENFDNVRKVKGEEHGMWKGGISSPRQRLMSSKVYKDWRIGVFERDSYICQKCGQVGGKLHAHHSNNYTDYENERTNVDNGITLCKNCHDGFHIKYGRNGTDGMMIKEFIFIGKVLND